MSQETATRLSNDLIAVLKLMHSLRQHAPRLHPGADAAAYPLLFNLTNQPLRVSVLAERVHSDVSTVSRQVTTLAAHGLVEKLPDPADRRAFLVRLTSLAEDLLDRVREQRGRWFAMVLDGWTEAEAADCVAVLERLTAGLTASRDRLVELDTHSSAPTLSVRAATPQPTSGKENP
ncbi:MAG TPA: MarR family transcriptional regulator [Dermatophilaceae bacterium]|nr:MarR family transcriptional regulator [Dermatophilaceae bacterium]